MSELRKINLAFIMLFSLFAGAAFGQPAINEKAPVTLLPVGTVLTVLQDAPPSAKDVWLSPSWTNKLTVDSMFPGGDNNYWVPCGREPVVSNFTTGVSMGRSLFLPRRGDVYTLVEEPVVESLLWSFGDRACEPIVYSTKRVRLAVTDAKNRSFTFYAQQYIQGFDYDDHNRKQYFVDSGIPTLQTLKLIFQVNIPESHSGE